MKKQIFTFLLLALFSFKAGDYRSVYMIPKFVQSINSGDIDLDNDIDIITGHLWNSINNWGGIAILENESNGFFLQTDSVFLFGWQPTLIIENLDSNPFPEIIAKKENSTTEFLAIIKNNNLNDIEFLDLFSYEGIEFISTGDINGDSYKDIIIASNNGQFWGILYNNEIGNFTEPEYYNVTGYWPTDIACADLDSNGREDVVITGQNTEIYFSKPEGFETVLLEANYPKNEVYLVDFDNDGDKDIITFGCFWGYTYATFFENTGNQTFLSHTDFIFQNITSGNAVADFNNDSLPDVLFYSDLDEEFLLFYNIGNFQLGHMNEFFPISLNSKYISCADFDGNGYQDIVFAANFYAQPSYVEILFNDGAGNFQNDPVVGLTEKNKQLNIFSISPNPFHDHTTLAITLNETGIAEVIVYDPAGRKIKCITHQQLKGGENHRFTWDGTGADHQKCRPGIYLTSLVINGKQRQTVKVILN